MSFRDEESRPAAGFPLRWMVELKCSTIELESLARWRCAFRWKRGALQRDQVVPELNDAPPNQNCGNKKKDRRRDKRGTVIVFPNPVHGIARSTFNALVFHFRFTRSSKCEPQHLDPGRDFDVLIANDEIQRRVGRLAWGW